MSRRWNLAGAVAFALALGLAGGATVSAQGDAEDDDEARDAGPSARDASVDAVADAAAADPCPFPRTVIDRAGRCCLPGQRWGAAGCEGAPTSCAPGETHGEGGLCVARPSPARGDAGLRRERFEAPAAQGVPATMAVVPGGVMRVGDAWVEVGPFAIDRTEVSAGAYRRCVDAGVCAAAPDPFGQMANAAAPQVSVTRAMALRYCGWSGGRLPTSAEWSLAARGYDARRYPWGERAPDCAMARLAGCGGPAAVGSNPNDRSEFGALDVVGNVGEWVLDLGPRPPDRAPLQRDPGRDPRGATGLARGGSYLSTPAAASLARADSADPREARVDRGFRCARGL